MDKRIVKTRFALQQALIALLREKNFEDIEIQAITDHANTARVTFYRHYATKEELLLDTIEGVYQEYQQAYQAPTIEEVFNYHLSPPICRLFEFLEKDRALHKKLFTGSVSATIQRRLRHYIVAEIVALFSKQPRFADIPVMLLANHVASATIGNIMWWLSDDLPYPPLYMARLTHWMSFTGAMTLLGRGGELALPPESMWKLPDMR